MSDRLDQELRRAFAADAAAVPPVGDLEPAVRAHARRRHARRVLTGSAAAVAAAVTVALIPWGGAVTGAPVAPATREDRRVTATYGPDAEADTEAVRALPTGPVPAIPVPYVVGRDPQGRPGEIVFPDGRRVVLTDRHPSAYGLVSDARGAVVCLQGADFTGATPDQDAQVVAIDPRSSTPRVLASGGAGNASLSPDGTQVLVEYTVAATAPGREPTTRLEIVDRATGNVVRRHEADDRRLVVLGWGRAGIVAQVIAVQGASPVRRPVEVAVLDPVTFLGQSMTWDTPAGQTTALLFSPALDVLIHGTAPGNRVTALELSGARMRQEATVPAWLSGALTPDGGRLVTRGAVYAVRTLQPLATVDAPLGPSEGDPVWDTGFVSSVTPPDGGDPLWYTCSWAAAAHGCHRLENFPARG